MGSGIAQVAAQTGHDVVLVDVNDGVLKKSEKIIKDSLMRVARRKFPANKKDGENFIAETLGRLKMETESNKAVALADLVIEAVVENLELKRKIFAELDKVAPKHTVFVSNTSSLSIQEIASVTSRMDQFGGLHFFNPVPVMKLLEVIRIPETSHETYALLLKFGTEMGKTTVESKDSMGFIVNRLLVPYVHEAIKLLERGDASAKDIDVAMKLGCGYPMGPIELVDYTGLDTHKYIIDGWHKAYPENPLYEPSPLLDKYVKEGKLGRKVGQGFFTYQK